VGLILALSLATVAVWLLVAPPSPEIARWLAASGIALIATIATLGHVFAVKVFRRARRGAAFALPLMTLVVAGPMLDASAFFSHHSGYVFFLGMSWFFGVAAGLWTLTAFSWPGRQGPRWRRGATLVFGFVGLVTLAYGARVALWMGSRVWIS
jgi:hypothetical protein